jgi:hypothetical protein
MKKERDPIVFITNQRSQDFSAATKFGILVAITSGTVNIFNVDSLQRKIQENLTEYNPAIDSIMIAGNAVVAGMVIAEIVRLYPESKIRLLIYDGMNQDYVKRII